MTGKKRHGRTESILLKTAVYTAAALVFAALLCIVVYMFIKGVPNLKPELFSLKYTTSNNSLMPALINTFLILILTLIISVPAGVFTAVYLVEYAKKSKISSLIMLAAETLSGIPSIIYGLFGYLFFVTWLRMNNSLLAGAITLAIMVLPVIIKTSCEAISAIPEGIREGSFGLGVGKLSTVFKLVLPSASPGILSGIILSVGRMIGETAALIYTSGTAPQVCKGLFSSGRTLSVHMYMLWKEGLSTDKSYAVGVVLLVLVLCVNLLSELLASRLVPGGKTEKSKRKG